MFKSKSFWLIVLGVFIFNALFWCEKSGINTLIFTLFTVIGWAVQSPQIFRRWQTKTTVILTIISAIFVTWHNSYFSIIIFYLSFLVMIGYAQHEELQTAYSGLLQSMIDFIVVPHTILTNLKRSSGIPKYYFRALAHLRYALISIIILPFFLVLYLIANQDFASNFDKLMHLLYTFVFAWIFELSFARIFFLGFAFVVMVVLFLRSQNRAFTNAEQDATNDLVRQKPTYKYQFAMLALRDEYRVGAVLLVGLNLLLLLVNLTDIQHVWLADYTNLTYAELREFLHDGTYTLIFSILLAMTIIVYFFRGKLNFYSKNQLLKTLAYIWIGQNALLAASVLMRNMQYINSFGLAYKRIGVLIFLILIIIGLATMVQKVAQRKSFFYLLNANSWATYIVLVFATCIGWDIYITNYNLKFKEVDFIFLVQDVSDKNIPLLWQQRNRLKDSDTEQFKQKLDLFVMKKYKEAAQHSFPSWNLADAEQTQFWHQNTTAISAYLGAHRPQINTEEINTQESNTEEISN